MGKASKWLRRWLRGKKGERREKNGNGNGRISQNSTITEENPPNPISFPLIPPKEKRRWSFRRSSASASAVASRELNPLESNINKTAMTMQVTDEADNEKQDHAMAESAAQAAAAVIHLISSSNGTGISIQKAAAIKIQSAFRSYLARKALCALKGLVKLQALVRGHLVRKQATATLRSMQALVKAQARARARRIRMAEGVDQNQKKPIHRKSLLKNRSKNPDPEMERSMEENIKIVEMDYASPCMNSPSPSAMTDFSPRTYTGHFEHYSAVSKSENPKIISADARPAYAAQMSHVYPLFPSYMANTESSRAKVRSQSAPKQRPDSFDRQTSRRRASIEGRSIPWVMGMQRSASHIDSTAKTCQYPWSLKLEKSTVSHKDSDCGSTSTMHTFVNY